jgi:hypothetical protein
MGILDWIRERVLDASTRPALDRYARDLYAARLRALGWKERPGESGEQKLLRSEIVDFLALAVRDPATRARLEPIGKRYLGPGAEGESAASSSELLDAAVAVAVQQGDDALFERALERLRRSQDPIERSRLLGALASVTDARSARALALTLDPVLRSNEVLVPLRYQTGDERTREAAFQYLERSIDAIVQRISPERSTGLPSLAAGFCSQAGAERAQALFAPRVETLRGSRRVLASTVEGLALCAARVEQVRAPLLELFAKRAR